jgi:hypothetical protein
MGKTPQPLTIVVWSGWVGRPEIQDLAAKGHVIIPDHAIISGDTMPDLFIHPTAHRWDDAYWKMLPVVLTQARRRKKAAK